MKQIKQIIQNCYLQKWNNSNGRIMKIKTIHSINLRRVLGEDDVFEFWCWFNYNRLHNSREILQERRQLHQLTVWVVAAGIVESLAARSCKL